MKFLDLFAGIGGFRLGMEQVGHECVGWVECDPYCEKCKEITKHVPSERNFTICTVCGKKKRQHARFSYESIHDTEGEWTAYDITSVTNDDLRQLRDKRGRIDIICGGFPCQAFSIAGKRGGFHDTRGTLFFEIVRIANILRPRYLFLENVKGLLNHDNGNTFETILRTLDELGYDAEWEVLNSKDFGVPQNRERVFIIGHSREGRTRKVFPIRGTNATGNVAKIKTLGLWKETNRDTGQRIYSINGVFATLTTKSHMKDVPKIAIKEATKRGYKEAYPGDSVNLSVPNSETRRGRVGEQIANTLDTGCQQGVVTEDIRIRKLTPRECWRLQGFPDWAFDKAKEVNSDSQLYKQAGNSVTVNVIYEIAKRLG